LQRGPRSWLHKDDIKSQWISRFDSARPGRGAGCTTGCANSSTQARKQNSSNPNSTASCKFYAPVAFKKDYPVRFCKMSSDPHSSCRAKEHNRKFGSGKNSSGGAALEEPASLIIIVNEITVYDDRDCGSSNAMPLHFSVTIQHQGEVVFFRLYTSRTTLLRSRLTASLQSSGRTSRSSRPSSTSQ